METSSIDPVLRSLTLRTLREYYDDFTMRHFEELVRNLGINNEDLRRSLRPSSI